MIGDEMFVFGGVEAGTRKNDLVALDLRAGQWRRVEVEGVPPSPRCYHAAWSTLARCLLIRQ